MMDYKDMFDAVDLKGNIETINRLKDKILPEVLEEIEKYLGVWRMETCEYCKWYYKEHCCNGLSEMCTEMVSDDDNCKMFEYDNGDD